MDRSKWWAELAWIEASTAELDAAGHPEEALDLLERVPTAELVGDWRSTRRLIANAEALHAPGAEPGWHLAGIPVAIIGAVGVIATGVAYDAATRPCSGWVDTCGPPPPLDLTPFVVGFTTGGAVLLIGLALNILGLVNHTFDPERRAFDRRRSDVVRGFLDAQRGVELQW